MVDKISYFLSMMPKAGHKGHTIQIKRTWMEDEDFNTLVMSLWKSYETQFAMEKTTMKLKNLKKKVCIWERNKNNNLY